jgi:hypothetical protein
MKKLAIMISLATILFFLVLLLPTSMSLFSIWFNDTLTSNNLTFTDSNNYNFTYIEIFKNANFSKSSIFLELNSTENFSLSIGDNEVYRLNNSINYSYNFSAFEAGVSGVHINTTNCPIGLNDSNLSTSCDGGYNVGLSTSMALFLNFSAHTNEFKNLKFNMLYYSQGFSGVATGISCDDDLGCPGGDRRACFYNWSSNKWTNFWCEGFTFCFDGYCYQTKTINLPMDSLNKSNLKILIKTANIITGSGSNFSINETWINYTYSKTNITIEFNNSLNTAFNQGLCNCYNCSVSNNNSCIVKVTFSSKKNSSIFYDNLFLNFTTKPLINLTLPNNGSSLSYEKNFTCNVSEVTPLLNMTFFIWNSSKDIINQTSYNISGIFNSSITLVNFTKTDTYHWNCLAFNNESYFSWASQNLSVIVDVSNPATNLNYPSNNLYLNNGSNVNFNCTVEGDNLDSVFLYGNFSQTYKLNKTILGITIGQINSFKLNLSDGGYSWTCMANKSNSETHYPSLNGNYSLNIDSIFPTISIAPITATAGSQTITFDAIITDANIGSCKYSIYNSSSGIDGLNSNISYTCNLPTPATVTAYGTYTLRIYALDRASNENYTERAFITSPSAIIGGGGGGGSVESKIPVIGLNKIDKPYTDLQRETIYAKINEKCSQILRGELAVADYSSECRLDSTQLDEVIKTLKSLDIQVPKEDIFKFYDIYKKSGLFQGFETAEIIKKYGLFTSVLGITNPFSLSPPSFLGALKFIFSPTATNVTISEIAIGNKQIAFCEVISETPDLYCETTNSSVKILYDLKDTNFVSKVFSGTISVTTSNNNPNLVEQRKIPIAFNVYNLGYSFGGIPLWAISSIVGIFIILGGIVIFNRMHVKRLKLENFI